MTSRPKCEPPCIHPDDIIGAADVRQLVSKRRRTRGKSSARQPISRNTFLVWRRDSGFPEPIKVLEGAGPGGADVELWDRRAVKDWLKTRKET